MLVSQADSKRAYHHGDLRQALLDATVDLIGDEDIDAVSLRAIARRVGVSAAAPYHHFKDKNDLLAAVGTDGFEKMRASIDAAANEAESDPASQLGAMGTGYVGFAVEHPAHYRVMFGSDRKNRDEYPELHCAGDACFERLINATQTLLGDEATEESVRRVALTCWSTCHGIASLWNDGQLGEMFEGATIEVLLSAALQTLFEGLPAPKAPKAPKLSELSESD